MFYMCVLTNHAVFSNTVIESNDHLNCGRINVSADPTENQLFSVQLFTSFSR